MALPLLSKRIAKEDDRDRAELSLYTVRDLVTEYLSGYLPKQIEAFGMDQCVQYIERIQDFQIYHLNVASLLAHKREVFNGIPAAMGIDLIKGLYLFIAAHIVTGFGEATLERFCNDLIISAHISHLSFVEHESSYKEKEVEREQSLQVLRTGAVNWMPMVILLKLAPVEFEEGEHGN